MFISFAVLILTSLACFYPNIICVKVLLVIALELEVSFVNQWADRFFELLIELYSFFAYKSIHVLFNTFLLLKSLADFFRVFFDIVTLAACLFDHNCVAIVNRNIKSLKFLFFLWILLLSGKLFIFLNFVIFFYFFFFIYISLYLLRL